MTDDDSARVGLPAIRGHPKYLAVGWFVTSMTSSSRPEAPVETSTRPSTKRTAVTPP